MPWRDEPRNWSGTLRLVNAMAFLGALLSAGSAHAQSPGTAMNVGLTIIGACGQHKLGVRCAPGEFVYGPPGANNPAPRIERRSPTQTRPGLTTYTY